MFLFLEPEEILLSQQQNQTHRVLLTKELRETDEHRQIRLQKHSDYKKRMLATESEEERTHRLSQISALKKQRLAYQSDEQ